jgi:altronate dehydratase
LKPDVIIIDQKDNVGVALHDIEAGQMVRLPDGESFAALDKIPFSHKVAITRIRRGADIVKYGEVIGQAAEDIKPGAWVHVQNLTFEE